MRRLILVGILLFAGLGCSDDEAHNANQGDTGVYEEDDVTPLDGGTDSDTGGDTGSAEEDVELDVDIDKGVADDTGSAEGDVEVDSDVDESDSDVNEEEGCEPLDEPTFDWVAAPTVSPEGSGTAEDPMDLATLLSSSGPVTPGDRVLMQAGTYLGQFTSSLSGTADDPIQFIADPTERVILDSNIEGDTSGLTIEGEWTEFYGLEITSSSDVREERVSGVTIYGANTKLVNSVIYDTAQGVSFWTPAVDSELYGNIIYNNGYNGPTRGHGHAIYMQNDEGTKRLANNIIFFGYGFGIHAYTEGGSLRGFDIVDNTWFRTGASVPGSSVAGTSDGCLVGGLQPVAETELVGNHSWGPSADARSTRIGWGGDVQNEDITFLDNYFVGRVGFQGHWESGTLEGNSFYGELSGADPAEYPNNTYSQELPTGSRVVIQPNEYDPRRSDLIIYNWEELESISADLSQALEEGQAFEIYSVFDLFGEPVAQGVYEDGDIDIPMDARPPVQPRADDGAISGADDPGRLFGVFVLLSGCAD